MKTHRLLMVGAWILAAFVPLGAAAKGIVEITISGPGLAGEVKVTDEATMGALSEIGGSGVPANLLPALGADFYAIRIGIGHEGEVFQTSTYHYFPDPAGGQGYVLFYDVEGGYSVAEGLWHRAPAAWDGAFRRVLLSHGVGLTPAVPAGEQAEVAAAQSPRLDPIVGLALAAIAAAVGAGLGLRRMRAAQR